jgi:hypothetical protein
MGKKESQIVKCIFKTKSSCKWKLHLTL